MNIVSAPENGLKLEVASVSLCPLQEGMYVPCGWKNLFWNTVDAIGEAVRVPTGWLVPVRYKSGAHGLVHYVFGDMSVVRFDTIANVVPDNWDCRRRLSGSFSMPRIVSTENGVLIVHVTAEEEADDLIYAFHGEETYEKLYELHLYGIVGSRNGRIDTDTDPGTSEADASRPVKIGHTVSRGYSWLFFRTVAEVGAPLQIAEWCYVPVRYRNGDYALLCCRVKDGARTHQKYGEPQEVCSELPWVTKGIVHSTTMPEIAESHPNELVLHTTSESHTWDITLSRAIGGEKDDSMLQTDCDTAHAA